MKRISFFAAGLCLVTGSGLFAQSRAGAWAWDRAGRSPSGDAGVVLVWMMLQGAGSMPDGIARVRGRLVYVKEGRATELAGAQRFAEGLSVESDGSVQLRDGRVLRLRENQMVTMGGRLQEAPRNIAMPERLNERQVIGRRPGGLITPPPEE